MSRSFIDERTKIVRKHDLALLFSDEPFETKQKILQSLAPTLGPGLVSIFAQFLENERQLDPLPMDELFSLFDACSDAERDPDDLLAILYALAPGNGRIGYRHVNLLADHLRERIARFMQEHRHPIDQLVAHDHVFGSGGDFCKTIHASTIAAIVVAPLVRVCKTGTTNVTSFHGSAQAMTQIGYESHALSIERINNELLEYGFAFVPLSSMGFPYSASLKTAREWLWRRAKALFDEQGYKVGAHDWQEAVRTVKIPLDIFKIVSPNAQVLHPINHTTGVCAPGMIPYVMSLYFHLGSRGIIVHNYDTVDEVVNASSNLDADAPNNLLIQVEEDEVVIAECGPEDLDFKRADLSEIGEEEDLGTTNDDFWRIISGQERGPKRDFIVANAAVLLVAAGLVPASIGDFIDQLRQGCREIERLIDSGKTEENFRKLLNIHQQKL
jgi:anthranilate phosphoribosyltransferase